jgi:endonuclease YncB( thermonuclease family)
MRPPTSLLSASAWPFDTGLRSVGGTARQILKAALAGLLALLPLLSLADTLSGEVVGITDGDTLTLLDSTKTLHKIRLAGIDAPEKGQAFGESAKQNLAALVFRKQVTVEWTKVDRYGRVVGKVLLGSEDVCLAQVRAGLAWHYKAYQREQSRVDRERYAQAEDEARQLKRTLWRNPSPISPWTFRHLRKDRY